MWTEVFLAGMVFGVFALVYMLWNFGRDSEELEKLVDLPDRQQMKSYLLWKSFYVNPDDPRGWVSKTSGFGKTVNFRKHKNAYVFALMIAFTLISAFGYVFTVF